jgi:hypothetical protein
MLGSLSSNDLNQPKILDDVRRYLRLQMSTGLRAGIGMVENG